LAQAKRDEGAAVVFALSMAMHIKHNVWCDHLLKSALSMFTVHAADDEGDGAGEMVMSQANG